MEKLEDVREAGAEKVEVTPAMIEAGVEVFACVRDLKYETEEEAVEQILKAALGSQAAAKPAQEQR